MKSRTIVSACVPFTLLAAVAGCSTTDSPAAPSSSPSASPTSQAGALPHSGAPKVANPLPSSVLSGDPCQTGLTAAQVKEVLGSGETQQKSDHVEGLGPSCSWSSLEKGSYVAVGYDTDDKEGLSGWYERTKPQAVVWRELSPVQWFPAVAHVTPSGGEPDEFCQVSIGVNDQQTADVTIFLSSAKKGKTDPCTVASTVSGMVVKNLQQKAGS
ncbi:DUF3558 domain-containing protein [Amycolatopsis ultiminotia]|uniref:DUF3558 domain-containing protein n=1 Tax=Amycolatopsis ultiminotia TaxID=543629 RepID=A0ABP6Y4R5_9PSEU